MQTHYQSSKGSMAIATMPLPYLKNALAKLEREDGPADVIEAMRYRLENEPQEQADDANPRAVIGANNPPPETGWEAIKAHCDDLLIEARNWADGATVENAEQDAEIDRLIDDIRKAAKAAEEAREVEKAPLAERVNEIQARYNVYIAPLKNKTPGKLMLAMDALKEAARPWREAQEAAKKAAAEKARQEAEEAAAKALEAVRAASPADLDARDAAEELVRAARQAEQQANRAAKGASSGNGLSTYYEPVLTDQKEAILHYMRAHPQRFLDLALELAWADVRAGKRAIPGFEVKERKRVI